MIKLDARALLGGATKAERATAGKVGQKDEGPAKAAPVVLDAGRLLSRGPQAHGAKIGDGKMMSPFAQQLPPSPAKSE